MNAPLVLHVEDDPNDRLILSILFKKSAAEVDLRTAADGAEAVDYLAGRGAYADRHRHPLPRLVILDLKLPKMNGFEVLAWARAQASLKDVPIIILSSSQEKGDVQRAFELGASSYLVKSVDMASMREIVKGIVELARLST